MADTAWGNGIRLRRISSMRLIACGLEKTIVFEKNFVNTENTCFQYAFYSNFFYEFWQKPGTDSFANFFGANPDKIVVLFAMQATAISPHFRA